ncbi:sigma-54-dependent transcriptional regulator [Geotalea daltonii FRC-32]|uniref:Sigma-54-dependent transcriptional regulator n=1 Tax=Geotalea daltonii (strain DSM 22248 / JCM 15807 / FRC-32) TaxID=316067 RepID=B9M7Z6_GEODF|nr:sigma 54-interacting transcriptional regulator [Geotalea daltonii]ACM18454.1 sigma-54-dependent transcriptional regulator [Geotalea daltonii FRC-32]
MNKKIKINQEDRVFFETVAKAAFANPFGGKRDELDALIGGVKAGISPEKLLAAVVGQIRQRIIALKEKDAANLRHWEGEDREAFRIVVLFHLFHRHLEDFDRLTQNQLKSGEASCPVPFARTVLGELHDFGFAEHEALRFLAVFYQLRRAFYFIKNGLVGNSPSMRTLRKHLWNCVFTHDIRWFESRFWDRMEDFSVLLLGATGTGKGAAASAIGRSGFIPFDVSRNCFSESFTRNFVAINLSQFSEGVLESELFGHRKGAFTGAMDNYEGLFSRCAPHGVIFLDEIGDVSLPVQIKLLQVLQERQFSPVGSHERKRFSGRVVAATNRPLEELRREGKFRDDFYYRLCSDVVHLPSLRQRLQESPQELDLLLTSILARLAGNVTPREQQLVKKVLERDLGGDYAWPGNVRELEQAVKRIIITGRCQRPDNGQSVKKSSDLLVDGIKEGNLDAESLLAQYCSMLYSRYGTYEEVARRMKLDRRTVKKYISSSDSNE